MDQSQGSNQGSNLSQQSSPLMGNAPMDLSSPSLSSVGSLTPQPRPAQIQQLSNGGSPQPQSTQGLSQSAQGQQAQHAFTHITPQQAHQLLRQFNIAKQNAQQMGLQTAGGKQNLRKAQRIKAILIQYNRRQKAQRQQQQLQQLQHQQGQVQQGQAQKDGANNSGNTGTGHTDLASLTPDQQLHIRRQQQLSKYQQISKLAGQFRNQLRAVEARKAQPNTPANVIVQLNQKETEIKTRMEQCRRFAQQIAIKIRGMQQQIQQGSGESSIPQGQGQSTQNEGNAQSVAAAAAAQQFRGQLMPQQNQILRQNMLLQQQKRQQLEQQQKLQQEKLIQQRQQVEQQQQQKQQIISQAGASGKVTKPSKRKYQRRASKSQDSKNKTPKIATPTQRKHPGSVGPSGVSASAGSSATPATNNTTDMGYNMRPRFQNISIPQELKVSAPAVASVKMNNRPSLLGGSAIDSPALTNPTFIRPQHFELEGSRVLNKRKLRELVRYVGSEEGDTDVTIDGDVEDMLLDLADEFVTSVTSFACRLAKHRKSDSLDVRDVQLHLERNWNIRIPGYAADEIRSTRKFMPNSAHNSKLNGLSINKSVNKGK